MRPRIAIALALVAIAVIGGAAWRVRGGRVRAVEPACTADRACATERAIALRKATKGRYSKADGDLYLYAMVLEPALERADCDAVVEVAMAIGRVPIEENRPDLEVAAGDAHDGALGACPVAMTPTSAPPPDATITLERGGCEGTCPAYVVTVRADGEVTWNGKRLRRHGG